MRSCSICQSVKIDRQPRHAPLHPHDPPAAPCEVIGVDFVGPLPESEGKNMICVITCHYTKFVLYTACRDTINSEELAKIYDDRLYGMFGMPRRIISDRGSVFVSAFTCTLIKIHSIEGNPSTAYHSQTRRSRPASRQIRVIPDSFYHVLHLFFLIPNTPYQTQYYLGQFTVVFDRKFVTRNAP